MGALQAAPPPVWEGRAIATHKLRLVEFSAFMESQNREEVVGYFYNSNSWVPNKLSFFDACLTCLTMAMAEPIVCS